MRLFRRMVAQTILPQQARIFTGKRRRLHPPSVLHRGKFAYNDKS